MKILLTLLIGLGLIVTSGCDKPEEYPTEYTTVVTIEGCEYFRQLSYAGLYNLYHKGNCTNSIHSYKTISNKKH